VLSALQPGDLARAAHVLRAGGVVALPFNGIFALFGDADRPVLHQRIQTLKHRPADKPLARVTLPEHANDEVDFARVHAPRQHIVALWFDLHALGIILPAKRRDDTVLLVWTEYPPLRQVLEHFRELGGRTLVGTSANRTGQPTATSVREVWQTFAFQLDAILADDFSHLPHACRRSTTIVDLTLPQPRLHRVGSVSPADLQRALTLHGFGALQVGRGARRQGSTTRRKPAMISPTEPIPMMGTMHVAAFGIGG
jgi:L-threonylcarbamoyladenylate synthase